MVHLDVPPHAGPRLALCPASRDHPGALTPSPELLGRSGPEEMHRSPAPPGAALSSSTQGWAVHAYLRERSQTSGIFNCLASGKILRSWWKVQHPDTWQLCLLVYSGRGQDWVGLACPVPKRHHMSNAGFSNQA